MQTRLTLCIGMLLFYCLASWGLALADSNADAGYEVVLAPEPGDVVAYGTDGDLTFWQLPLWVQASVVLAALASAVAAVHVFPYVLGKIKDVLENGTRTHVYGYIEDNPGCTVPEISKRAGMSPANVKYHINILEKSKKISSRMFGKHLRLFKNSGAYSDREQLITAAFKNETARDILFAILEQPGLTNRQLSIMFDITDSTAHWHTDRLVNEKILTNQREGRETHYYLVKDVEIALPKILKAAG